MNDNQLIRRIIARDDRVAADQLISRYYDEIYRYAYRQSMDQADPKNAAQDLTQEIFISVLRSLYTFNSKKASFRTWLYRVANSRVIDARRQFSPTEVQIDEIEVQSPTDFTVDLQNRELLFRIEENISTQPSDIQHIIRLHIYRGMTFGEIALVMELTESTVKTKFYRSIRKVREVFQDEY